MPTGGLLAVVAHALVYSPCSKAMRNQSRLTDCDFADDVGMLATTKPALQRMTISLEEEAAKVGLRISAEKTKVLTINRKTKANITVGDKKIEEVKQFTYLGSVMTGDGGSDEDVDARIGKAAAVFKRMRPMWSSASINEGIKIRLFTTIIVPTALYGCETWRHTERIAKKLNVFQQRCLRRIFRISYLEHKTNDKVLKRANVHQLEAIVTERRMRLAGHVLRMNDDRHPKTAMRWTPRNGKRRVGAPRITWRRTFIKDLEDSQDPNIRWVDAEQIAADRRNWRSLVARCAGMHGGN
uniref:Reverse transcriptase domain-containing protein n=1 Tax=Plectus sambesii TaxID=2011161 RepID=A0A914UPB0_9BILA